MSGEDARDRKLALPADAVRMRAKQCDASDVDRLRWLLHQRRAGGLFPTWLKALRGALQKRGDIDTLLQEMEQGGEMLRDKDALNAWLGLWVGKLEVAADAATVTSVYRGMKEYIYKAMKRCDGPKSTIAMKNNLRCGRAPVGGVVFQGLAAAQAVYPDAKRLKAGAVGRLPATSVDRRSLEAEWSALPPRDMPCQDLVTPVPSVFRWSVRRFWAMLDRTAFLFPCALEQHATTISKAGLEALATVPQGRAIVLREKFDELVKGGAAPERWLKNLHTNHLNTVTSASASVSLIATLGPRRAGGRYWSKDVSCVVVSDHQYISALGFPLMPSHPARMVGGPLEVAQLRQLAGQSVDRDMTKATLSKIFEVLEQRGLSFAGTTISFGDWFAGGSFLGSAVWELADTLGLGFSYTFAIEGLRLAASGHQYGWCGMPRGIFSEVCDVTVEQLRSLCPPGAIIGAGGRCAPFSGASATHQPGTERKDGEKGGAIMEFTTAINVSVQLEPNAIFIETSDSIRTDARHIVEWQAMQAICMAHGAAYDWSWQSVCPKVLLGKPMPRRRMFIVATRWEPIGVLVATAVLCDDDELFDVEVGSITDTYMGGIGLLAGILWYPQRCTLGRVERTRGSWTYHQAGQGPLGSWATARVRGDG